MTDLAKKLTSKKSNGKKSAAPKKTAKKTAAAKKTAKKTNGKKSEVVYRTKMENGKPRKVYKAGSGMIEELTKMLKSNKSIDSIARHFGKENKDISWYVSRLKKNGELPKSYSAKYEDK